MFFFLSHEAHIFPIPRWMARGSKYVPPWEAQTKNKRLCNFFHDFPFFQKHNYAFCGSKSMPPCLSWKQKKISHKKTLIFSFPISTMWKKICASTKSKSVLLGEGNKRTKKTPNARENEAWIETPKILKKPSKTQKGAQFFFKWNLERESPTYNTRWPLDAPFDMLWDNKNDPCRAPQEVPLD